MLDEVEEGRLRPMEVVQNDHQWAVRASASNSLRTAQIVSAVGALVVESPTAPATLSAISSVVLNLDQRGEVGRSGGCQLAHDVQKREVGDALAVGRQRPTTIPTPVLISSGASADQPRLADPARRGPSPSGTLRSAHSARRSPECDGVPPRGRRKGNP